VAPEAFARRPSTPDAVAGAGFNFLEFRTLYERLLEAVDDPTLPATR
jgi:hypothetical protein